MKVTKLFKFKSKTKSKNNKKNTKRKNKTKTNSNLLHLRTFKTPILNSNLNI
jgi:hypothetical protein